MPDRLLTEPFETIGEWHLPEAPDKRISGTLKYTGGRTELDLIESFVPARGHIRAGDSHTYPLVYGVTRDSEPMTLINANRSGWSLNFGAGGLRQPERLSTNILVAGAHVPPDWLVRTFRFRIPGLHIWHSRPIIEWSHVKDEAKGLHATQYRVLGLNEEVMRVDAICGKVSWYLLSRHQHDQFGGISVDSQGWCQITPDEPQRLEWYFDKIGNISILLSFLAGSPMVPDQFMIPLGEGFEASILVHWNRSQVSTVKNIHEFLLPRSALGADFFDVLNRWFEVCPNLSMPSSLAMSILASEELWLHMEFLSLLQVLEGFHRAVCEGTYMSPDDFKAVEAELKKAIPSAVGSDHRQSLASRIHYGNEISLAKRLNELANRLSTDLRALLFGPGGKIPRSWVDTRNYFTHWDEGLRANCLDSQNMVYVNERLRHFVRIVFLDLIGIPQDRLVAALQGASDKVQFLAQINAIERQKADPSFEPAPIMSLHEGSIQDLR